MADTILITGGCGFLGSNLAEESIKKGNNLIVFDNLSRKGAVNNLNWLKTKGDFLFIHGDIRNQNDIEKVVREQKPDLIFHLAGQVAMTTSIENPRLDFEINVLGTFNLLDSIRRYSPESAVIYSSTNKVYGDLEYADIEENETRYLSKRFPNGFPESIGLDFHSPYGTSKGSADQYMLDFNRIFGLKTVVFRHSSMYGGRQFASYDQGWIGWFCQKAIETKMNITKEPFTISGNGKQVRDVLHAEDMINLYYTASTKVDQIVGQAFNIGGGIKNSYSLLELFAFLEKELEINLSFTKTATRVSDQKVFVADILKAKEMIGWEPNKSREEGIRQMLEWTRNIIEI